MIGGIKLPKGTTAVLRNNGQWISKNPILAFELNLWFRPDQHGPACMNYGVCAIGAAAHKYKAKTYYKVKPLPLPKGVIS